MSAIGEAVSIPPMSAHLNQTSSGTFTIWSHNVEVLKLSSMWMQDDVNKRLFLSVGEPSEPGFIAQFFIFEGLSYHVYKDSADGELKCDVDKGKGYDEEIGAYDSPEHFSFVSEATLYEWDPTATYDLHMGVAPDLVGPLNVMLVSEEVPSGRLFRGMYTLGGVNSFHYSVYRYDQATNEVPAASYYVVPDVCFGSRK